MGSGPHCPRCGAPTAPGSTPGALCRPCRRDFGREEGPEIVFTRAGGEKQDTELDLAEIGRRLEKYEVLERIARGGMGTVYKARDRQLDRIVALKILPERARGPEWPERFRREAQALAKLDHPGIVRIYEMGEAEGLYYFAMEYVRGENLRQRMASGPIPLAEAVRLLLEVCEAVEFAHGKGVVHRDIKPENVLLDDQGRAKIADFGLAKLVRESAAEEGITRAGQSMGTPAYMAPEQFARADKVDQRADVYALGVLLYELLTGRQPGGTFPLPSKEAGVPEAFDTLVHEAMAGDLQRRLPSAEEFRERLRAIELSRSGVRLHRSPRHQDPRKKARSLSPMAKALLAALGGLAALALVPLAYVRFAAEQTHAEASHLRTRFEAARDALESDVLDRRVNAVNSLLRIAESSPVLRSDALERLSRLVRAHPATFADPGAAAPSGCELCDRPRIPRATPADVLAAVQGIGKLRRDADDQEPIDLSGACLQDADLRKLDLSGVNLEGADLSGAELYQAKLCGARLTGARLQEANLNYANLGKARLGGACLREATLIGADFRQTERTNACFDGAVADHAHWRGAWPGCADL